jgi:hypothetical protein
VRNITIGFLLLLLALSLAVGRTSFSAVLEVRVPDRIGTDVTEVIDSVYFGSTQQAAVDKCKNAIPIYDYSNYFVCRPNSFFDF